MKRLVYAMPGNDDAARRLAAELAAEPGTLAHRRFPDGESLVRLDTPPAGRDVTIVCTLRDPDPQVAPLLFAADAARELGARSVGLVAPYLAYMRQDRRFHAGEALTSSTFARVLSASFDWLVTVDPHLHRRRALSEIYAVPAVAVAAAPALADWICANIPRALLIGPDEESRQWTADVARRTGAPFAVLDKRRDGDRNVTLRLPDLAAWRGRTPVLVDDIVSSGATMVQALRALRERGFPPAACVAVHAVFSQDAHADLLAAGAAQVVSTNTIAHPSNRIDVSPAIAVAVCAIHPTAAPAAA